MHIVIRKYKGVTLLDEVIDRVEKGLLPQLKELPGFIAYYGIEFDDGDLGAVSIYETKDYAEKSTEKALIWVKENLSELLPNEPEILQGDVLFNSEAKVITKTA